MGKKTIDFKFIFSKMFLEMTHCNLILLKQFCEYRITVPITCKMKTICEVVSTLVR